MTHSPPALVTHSAFSEMCLTNILWWEVYISTISIFIVLKEIEITVSASTAGAAAIPSSANLFFKMKYTGDLQKGLYSVAFGFFKPLNWGFYMKSSGYHYKASTVILFLCLMFFWGVWDCSPGIMGRKPLSGMSLQVDLCHDLNMSSCFLAVSYLACSQGKPYVGKGKQRD